METLTRILVIGIGGALGAVARHALNVLFAKSFAPFPFATFFINVTGSLLIGFLLTLFSEKFDVHENLRLAIVVGFLGAYTTFSTFEFETFTLVRDQHLATAFLYASMSFAVGLASVIAGVWLAKKI
jgi:CrcB protein